MLFFRTRRTHHWMTLFEVSVLRSRTCKARGALLRGQGSLRGGRTPHHLLQGITSEFLESPLGSLNSGRSFLELRRSLFSNLPLEGSKMNDFHQKVLRGPSPLRPGCLEHSGVFPWKLVENTWQSMETLSIQQKSYNSHSDRARGVLFRRCLRTRF